MLSKSSHMDGVISSKSGGQDITKDQRMADALVKYFDGVRRVDSGDP